MKNNIGKSYLVYNGNSLKWQVLVTVIAEVVMILILGFPSVIGTLDDMSFLGKMTILIVITSSAFTFTGGRQQFFNEFRKSGTYLLTIKKPYKTFKTFYFVSYISIIVMIALYITVTEIIRLVMSKGAGFNFSVSLIYNLEMLFLMYGIIPFAMHLKNSGKSFFICILLLVLFSVFYILVIPERFLPVIFILPAAILILMPLSNSFFLKKVKACYEAE